VQRRKSGKPNLRRSGFYLPDCRAGVLSFCNEVVNRSTSRSVEAGEVPLKLCDVVRAVMASATRVVKVVGITTIDIVQLRREDIARLRGKLIDGEVISADDATMRTSRAMHPALSPQHSPADKRIFVTPLRSDRERQGLLRPAVCMR
jgi:hypothetical protein